MAGRDLAGSVQDGIEGAFMGEAESRAGQGGQQDGRPLVAREVEAGPTRPGRHPEEVAPGPPVPPRGHGRGEQDGIGPGFPIGPLPGIFHS